MRSVRWPGSVRPAVLASAVLFLLLAPPAIAPAREGRDQAAAADEFEVRVFYATNRKQHRDRSAEPSYGGERGEASFGDCAVRFTPIPLIGDVAGKIPFHIPSETREIRVAEHKAPEEFWKSLSAAARETDSGSLVVFVHGYNHGFARTCRMAAELQRGLVGRATVVMFSWPSNAGPAEYVRDQADVEWSVPFLADFLGRLGERFGRARIQLLAHSLGSRGSLLALWRLAADLPARPLIGRLVLLAPDFDSQTFVSMVPRLAPLTAGITLYASSLDTPLKVSRQLSGYPRLGEAGEFLTIVEGVETIDVSGSGRYQISGHEYFYYHPLVKTDLVELLATGESAAERPGLRERRRDGGRYWEIREAVRD